ncbi:hypothetical protein EOD41_07525 [Mucilaginibacter limnophilus]|uniref:PH domain-containing protein n=1 Tax=Mucilaginibacter limnophilus TaxID=1932778 RepID=A0A437MVV0_9SPHI|nr:hypothetical protein [Mucilaginibacter limnophilus]RVU01799.1 hypothetical protein EOD41_07525 [Mucilaginibacter limnophilus]
MELPYNGRAVIETTPGYAEISIPPKRNYFFLFIFGFWFTGWAIGGIIMLVSFIFSTPDDLPFPLFIIFPLFWAVPGFFVGRVLWWFIAGKEVISVQKDSLNIAKKGMLFNKPKSYYITECKSFRVSDNPINQLFPFGFKPLFFGGTSSGTIVFDYGMQTIKFADGIDEAEGKHILKLLKEKGFLNDNNF